MLVMIQSETLFLICFSLLAWWFWWWIYSEDCLLFSSLLTFSSLWALLIFDDELSFEMYLLLLLIWCLDIFCWFMLMVMNVNVFGNKLWVCKACLEACEFRFLVGYAVVFVVMQAYAVLLDACILKQFCRWLSFLSSLKVLKVGFAGLFGKAGLSLWGSFE